MMASFSKRFITNHFLTPIIITTTINVVSNMTSQAAMKEDVRTMKEDISILKQDVMVVKQDLIAVKQDFKHDVKSLKQDVKALAPK
jgi:DNA anti-recombination protein RmuC